MLVGTVDAGRDCRVEETVVDRERHPRSSSLLLPPS